jgi:hypothetical protein
LDETWIKGHSRLAEVYVAQERYELAMGAYAECIKLSSVTQKDQYKTKYEKAMANHFDPRHMEAGHHDPLKSGNGAMFARFRARNGPGMWTDNDASCRLGYLSAADKICNGYITLFFLTHF